MLNRFGWRRFDSFDATAVRQLAGVFLVVFGAVGFANYFMASSSDAGTRLLYACAVAIAWTAGWAVQMRVPSFPLTAVWIGAMLGVWQSVWT